MKYKTSSGVDVKLTAERDLSIVTFSVVLVGGLVAMLAMSIELFALVIGD